MRIPVPSGAGRGARPRGAALGAAALALAVWGGGASPAQAHDPVRERIERLDRALAVSPRSADLLLRRGDAYREARDWKRALADLEAAARLDPGLAQAELLRGQTLLEAGRPGEALPPLEQFLGRFPSHPRATLLRARALELCGRHLEAAAAFGRALRLDPHAGPEPFVERARALLGAAGPEHRALALGALDDGIRRLGPIPSLELPAVDLELALGNPDGALARVQALAAPARRKERWLALEGEILLGAGRRDEARAALRAALAAIEALPPGRRATPATLRLETSVRASLARAVASPLDSSKEPSR